MVSVVLGRLGLLPVRPRSSNAIAGASIVESLLSDMREIHVLFLEYPGLKAAEFVSELSDRVML
jgi:hypothetical protein